MNMKHPIPNIHPPKRVVAIIQARMSSSRLHGKILMDLAGKPLLWHVIDRLKRVKGLDAIVVATTTNTQDDSLVDYLQKMKVQYFRGSEDDVLNRFILTAQQFHADVIVRVCSDSPLIEPQEIDKMVSALLSGNADYVMAKPGLLCMHEGFEVVTLTALQKQLKFSQEHYVKEHVTSYIREHPSPFKIAYFTPEKEYRRKGFRLSVDTMDDLRFMREIYGHLYREGTIVHLKDAISLLSKHPKIAALNKDVTQKGFRERTVKIAFRVDGGSSTGMGHIFRTMHLARTFQNRFHWAVTFIVKKSQQSKDIIEERGYPVISLNENLNVHKEASAVNRIARNHCFDVIVFDLKKRMGSDYFGTVKQGTQTKIVLIDNISSSQDVDLIVLPIAHIDKKMIPHAIRKKCYFGLDYLIVSDSMLSSRKKKISPSVKNILITMGGSDPANITLLVMKYLSRHSKENPAIYQQLALHVVIGPSFKSRDTVFRFIKDNEFPTFTTHKDVVDLAPLLSHSDICIVSFGITTYECLVVGVPTLIISHSKKNYKSSRIYDALQVSINEGYYREISYPLFKKAFTRLIDDACLRQKSFARAQTLIKSDGKLAIAKLIRGLL